MRMTEVIASEAPSNHGVVALIGPTHAEEVARGIPTAIVAASAHHSHAKTIQRYFMTPRFRIYTNSDVIGVEVGSALKNVIAIAAGICDGLKYGDNTKAALMTRGLAEMRRLGIKMGADEKTFSVAGMGDLIVTCNSRLSRNRKVGMLLGHGRRLDDILKEMTQVAEGVINTRERTGSRKRYDVELPITNAVAAVLFKHGSGPDRTDADDPLRQTRVLLMEKQTEEGKRMDEGTPSGEQLLSKYGKGTFSIGEVSTMLGVHTHTIRFWEKSFRIVIPRKESNRRRYTLADITLLKKIQRLVHNEKLSLNTARCRLEAEGVLLPEPEDEEPAINPETSTQTAGS